MTKEEIIAFMNAYHDCHMATVEGDKPRVRGIGIVKADENGIVFQTSTPKDLYRQLSANPSVELCFNDYQGGIQVRVSGTVEPVDDIELKQEIITKRQFLKPLVERDGYGAIVLYSLKRGVAHVWTPKTNFDPKKYIQL
jgi:pyridoxamine 5'-phosphate oxidase